MLDTFATSKRRPATYANDIDTFREHCGGALTGTYHCVLPLGTSVLFDTDTEELLNAEGIVITEQKHLHAELNTLSYAIELAMEHGVIEAEKLLDVYTPDTLVDPASPESVSLKNTGPTAFEGILLRAKDGTGYFQIVDMHHPTLCLWQQINMLTDLFALLEKRLPHLRFSAHSPTSALRSPAQFRRWLSPWRKPGIAGVLIKKADFVAGGETTLTDACLVRCR